MVKGSGRPRELTLREALIVACGYERNNITEEIWAEIFDVNQSTISRCITFLTPLIDQATEEFRPRPRKKAAEATRGAVALVDGTLWPCWSLSGKREHDYNNQISSFRAPVERAIANLKTWRILFTDYRRPLETFAASFRAAIGFYFFKESFA